jgi:hypothetical protein
MYHAAANVEIVRPTDLLKCWSRCVASTNEVAMSPLLSREFDCRDGWLVADHAESSRNSIKFVHSGFIHLTAAVVTVLLNYMWKTPVPDQWKSESAV